MYINFIEVPSTGASEQFNLTLVSGDYPDIFTSSLTSTLGMDNAIDEDIILRLMNLESVMPNYATM